MRNVVRILTAGALVGCLSGGLVFAEGAVGPTFKVTTAQKVAVAGGKIEVDVKLTDGFNVGALQFMMKVTGGTQGTLKVIDIAMNNERSDYIFGPSDIAAVDRQQMRAGAVKMTPGGVDFESASIATVTLQFSKNAAGTFHLNVARNQETFLRDGDAVPINFLLGKDVTITVRDNATPTKLKRKRGDRR